MLRQVKAASTYPCPMCSSLVPSSAFYCQACGTDLTRAGAVLSSSGPTPRSTPRRRPRTWAALIVVTAALGVAAGSVGRPWIEPFTQPGMAVATAAAGSAWHSVRQTISKILE